MFRLATTSQYLSGLSRLRRAVGAQAQAVHMRADAEAGGAFETGKRRPGKVYRYSATAALRAHTTRGRARRTLSGQTHQGGKHSTSVTERGCARTGARGEGMPRARCQGRTVPARWTPTSTAAPSRPRRLSAAGRRPLPPPRPPPGPARAAAAGRRHPTCRHCQAVKFFLIHSLTHILLISIYLYIYIYIIALFPSLLPFSHTLLLRSLPFCIALIPISFPIPLSLSLSLARFSPSLSLHSANSLLLSSSFPRFLPSTCQSQPLNLNLNLIFKLSFPIRRTRHTLPRPCSHFPCFVLQC
jgi:hypothetical protein